jgi:hypothetical protein
MAATDDKYYKKKIIGWIKKPFWIHRKADMDKIKATIEYENNKAIDSVCQKKARQGLKELKK